MQALNEQRNTIRWYYDGLAQGELRAVKCEACGKYTFPPTAAARIAAAGTSRAPN